MSQSIRTVEKEQPERWRVALVLASAVVWSALVWSRGRIPQPPEYLRFVDTRDLVGIPTSSRISRSRSSASLACGSSAAGARSSMIPASERLGQSSSSRSR